MRSRPSSRFATGSVNGNPYRLDRGGMLYLPGVAGVQLAGLTQEQARLRLANDPALRDLLLRVTLLPLERQGSEALKPFGYDLFTNFPSTYAPITDVPVPSEYVVGPGDTIEVQLLGNADGEYTLTVGRDGTIQFPNLGPDRGRGTALRGGAAGDRGARDP